MTVGQRRGMGHGSDGRRRYVTHVDVAARRVTVGGAARRAALVGRASTGPSLSWVDRPARRRRARRGAGERPRAARAVHGDGRPARATAPADLAGSDGDGGLVVRFDDPQRPVAPGQTVALYDAREPDAVVGAGIAA